MTSFLPDLQRGFPVLDIHIENHGIRMKTEVKILLNLAQGVNIAAQTFSMLPRSKHWIVKLQHIFSRSKQKLSAPELYINEMAISAHLSNLLELRYFSSTRSNFYLS